MTKLHSVLILFIALLCINCKEHSNAPVFHESHEEKKQNAPFSDVVETKDFLFLSGQVGMNHTKILKLF